MSSDMEGNSIEAMKAPGLTDLSERAPTAAAEVVLRFAVSLLSVAALMLLVKDQQTVVVEVGNQGVVTELKYSDISAGFEYGVYSNGLVAFYCIVLALTSIIRGTVRNYGRLGAWILFILDQGFAYIQLSAASASSELADLTATGIDKSGWPEVCSTFGHFCQLLRASTVITFLSILLLAVISVISAHQLFSQYQRSKAVCAQFLFCEATSA